jgi:hypothetical protein
MAETEKVQRKAKGTEKVHPAQIFAEDMSEEWSKDAIKAARDAFALTIASGDVHATIADFIRKKFDRDHERYSPTHSPTHSLTHSPTHSPTHSQGAGIALLDVHLVHM